jgi:hypothetical protein
MGMIRRVSWWVVLDVATYTATHRHTHPHRRTSTHPSTRPHYTRIDRRVRYIHTHNDNVPATEYHTNSSTPSRPTSCCPASSPSSSVWTLDSTRYALMGTVRPFTCQAPSEEREVTRCSMAKLTRRKDKLTLCHTHANTHANTNTLKHKNTRNTHVHTQTRPNTLITHTYTHIHTHPRTQTHMHARTHTQTTTTCSDTQKHRCP